MTALSDNLMGDVRVFVCGKPHDHECNYNGPEMCGGTDSNGEPWQAPYTKEEKRRISWGSVSCSICGRTAQENSYWE